MPSTDMNEEYLIILTASTACAFITSATIVLGHFISTRPQRIVAVLLSFVMLVDVFSPWGAFPRELCRDSVPRDLHDSYTGIAETRATCIRMKDCLLVRRDDRHDFACRSPSAKVDMVAILTFCGMFSSLSGIV